MITCGGHQCQHLLCSIASSRRRPTFGHRWFRRQSETQRVLRCACQRISASDGRIDTAAEAILHRYWESRGIFDEGRRERLVAVARRLDHAAEWDRTAGVPVPDVTATYRIGDDQGGTDQVLAVSRRLLQLRNLLGRRDDVDLVHMLVREPRLLSASMQLVTQRLLDLRLSGAVDDVSKLVEAQPALLLQADVQLDGEETAAQRLEAWRHGLLSDNDAEWGRQLAALAAYRDAHGDTHVGHRPADDQELVRWAAKQRAASKADDLPLDRRRQLASLVFEFDDEAAEWRRWFNELRKFQGRMGHCNPVPLADGETFLLFNWCSVQRIAKRSRYLTADRCELLDSIGFDWTGADALS